MKRFKNINTFKKYYIKNNAPDSMKIEGIEYKMYSYDMAGEFIEYRSIEKHPVSFDKLLYTYSIDICNKNRYRHKQDTKIEEGVF